MTGTDDSTFDVAVIGGGASGYAAALTASNAGLRTVLFAPPASFPPGRTAALLQGSIDILAGLNVWPALSQHAAPLRAIRIVDATKRLIRAPEATFHATEIGLTAFGCNVPNGDLVDALAQYAQASPGITVAASPVQAVTAEDARVLLQSADRSYAARLAVGADGARSIAREAAGIRSRSWTHRQAALVATLTIEIAHGGVSTEFHTESGPFTLVPLPGDRVSLVWVDRPHAAERTAGLSSGDFSRLVEERAHSVHGAMQVDSAPAVFPLKVALAERFAGQRIILVGEAAHVFPPIGAQGLNLGFRDVAALKRILTRYRSDPGGPEATAAYHSYRQADIRTRTLAVEFLNRSLLTDFLPVQLARGIGLGLASSIRPLRRALMRQGLAPGMRALR